MIQICIRPLFEWFFVYLSIHFVKKIENNGLTLNVSVSLNEKNSMAYS